MEFIQHKGLSCVCIVMAFWGGSALIRWLMHGKKMLYVWCFKTSLEVKRRKPLDSFVLGGNKKDVYRLSKASSVEHKSSFNDSWKTCGLCLSFFKKLILVSNDEKWVERIHRLGDVSVSVQWVWKGKGKAWPLWPSLYFTRIIPGYCKKSNYSKYILWASRRRNRFLSQRLI